MSPPSTSASRQPKTTSSTAAGSTPERSTSALRTCAPRSAGWTPLSSFSRRPTGYYRFDDVGLGHDNSLADMGIVGPFAYGDAVQHHRQVLPGHLLGPRCLLGPYQDAVTDTVSRTKR